MPKDAVHVMMKKKILLHCSPHGETPSSPAACRHRIDDSSARTEPRAAVAGKLPPLCTLTRQRLETVWHPRERAPGETEAMLRYYVYLLLDTSVMTSHNEFFARHDWEGIQEVNFDAHVGLNKFRDNLFLFIPFCFVGFSCTLSSKTLTRSTVWTTFDREA